nr:MAG TPA: hypothetical protein [Caudoviricetes sp.]
MTWVTTERGGGPPTGACGASGIGHRASGIGHRASTAPPFVQRSGARPIGCARGRAPPDSADLPAHKDRER